MTVKPFSSNREKLIRAICLFYGLSYSNLGRSTGPVPVCSALGFALFHLFEHNKSPIRLRYEEITIYQILFMSNM